MIPSTIAAATRRGVQRRRRTRTRGVVEVEVGEPASDSPNSDDPSEMRMNGPKNPDVGRFAATFGVGVIIVGLVGLFGVAEIAIVVGLGIVSVIAGAIAAETAAYPFLDYSPLEANGPLKITRKIPQAR